MAILAGAILIFKFSADVIAAEAFNGSWSDNAVGITSIGNLLVKPDMIEVKNVARYFVVEAGSFGKGALFKVTGVNQRLDPMGCGPTSRITYIAIVPITPVEGTNRQGIDVIFYGGSAPPNSLTINDDRALCVSHPFGRGG